MKIGSSAALLFVLGCLTNGEAFHIARGVQSKLHRASSPRQGGTVCQLVSQNIDEDDEILLLQEEEKEDIYELQSQFYPLDTDPLRFIDTGDDRRSNFKATDLEFFLEIIIPVMTPLIAFLSYEPVASLFSASIDALSDNNWVAVDGGAYQAKIIAPVINAIVVPAIAVLFATLTATTISTLRLRQVDIRRAINMEAGELRNLESLVNSLPVNEGQDRLRNYLIQYASRIIHESQPRVGSGSDIINPSRGMDCELNGFVQVLSNVHEQLPVALVDQAFIALATLRQQRYNRITALQSTYPALHYAVLAVLAFGECTGFLMEANQEVMVFLNAVQLKILWSMLVGTFVACFTVFYDLRSPFSGSYQISASVDQLYTVRLALQASAKQATVNGDEAKQEVNGEVQKQNAQ